MAGGRSLVEQAILNTLHFDIETLGTERGSGIYEMSIYDPKERQVVQYLISPNLTISDPTIKGQDVAGYKSRAGDVFIEHPLIEKSKKFGRQVGWRDTVVAQVLMDEHATIFKGEMDKVYPNLKIADIMAMDSPAEFDNYLQQIRRIASDDKLFEKGVRESSIFLSRSLDYAKMGQVADANYIHRMQQELSDYIGEPIKFTARNITMDELFGPDSPFLEKIEGKHLAAANLNFESKQVGAFVGAQEQGIRTLLKEGKISIAEAAFRLQRTSPIRNVIGESAIGVSDAFVQTGEELTRAKTRAQVTGDYSDMLMPYLREATKVGATTTGDVLDISKIQQSLEQKLGLVGRTKPATMSVDVLQRLYGFSENISDALIKQEKHIGAFDILSQGKKVYPSALRQTLALHEVATGDRASKKLLLEADKGTGDITKALVTLKTRQLVEPTIQESNILTRLGRALEDIITKGTTEQTSGRFAYSGTRKRVTPGGAMVSRPVAMPAGDLITFDSLDDVLSHIKKDELYSSADFNKAIGEFIGTVNREAKQEVLSFDEVTQRFNIATSAGGTPLVTREHLKYLEVHKRDMINARFKELEKGLDLGSFNDYVKGMKNSLLSENSWIARHGNFKMLDFKVGKFAGLAAVGMSALGLAAEALGEQRIKHQRVGPESLRTMTYQRWLESNSEYYGLETQADRGESGFSVSGMASTLRKLKTDFGSPYQGPAYSSYVFKEQEMLNERRKYILKQFADVHFNDGGPVNDLLKSSMLPTTFTRSMSNIAEAMALSSSSIRRGNSFITDGEYVEVKNRGGLSAQKLFKVDLNNYQISAQDADTILLKRKGVVNALSNYFGFNRGQDSFSVRLSAIDAPETAKGYKEGMPGAQEALGRLRALMNQGKKIELFLNPSDITYGRQVGALFVDGRNVELDLVKSGNARFLDFKGKNKQIFDTSVFKSNEMLAQGKESGLWGNPYYKPFQEIISKSGKNLTFNTLVNQRKLAESGNLMSLSALMKTAGDMGFYSPMIAKETNDLLLSVKKDGFNADYKSPILFNAPNATHRKYIEYLKGDITGLMQNPTGNVIKKHSASSGYKKLDKKLSIDTSGTSTSAYSKRPHESFSRFGVDKQKRRLRRMRMTMAQRDAMRGLNESPIGHHRM